MASAREELRIGDKYCVGDRIGVGSFGAVFEGKCLQTGTYVAVKVEDANSKHPLLAHEARVYDVLNATKGVPGIPSRHWYGRLGAYNVLVVDLLGPSLERLLRDHNSRLPLRTTLQLAEQLVTRLEYLHSRNILHRDLKPDNILMGIGDRTSEAFMIDFGLSRRFTQSRLGPGPSRKPLVGTARYASIRSHLGLDLSWQDDLESLGYILVYLVRGKLPWQGMPREANDPNYSNVGQKKMEITLEELCEGLPPEFLDYMHIVRGLQFGERPDYAALRELFHAALQRERGQDDGPDGLVRRPSSEDGISSDGQTLPSSSLANPLHVP